MPPKKKEPAKALAPKCPRCNHRRAIKSGLVLGEQRWKCKSCAYQFTRFEPRGRPLWQKSLAVFLYSHGVSLHSIGRIFDVQPSTALKWVRSHSNSYATASPEKRTVMIMGLKEMAPRLARPQPRKKGGASTLWIAIDDDMFGPGLGISIGPPQQR